jgi:hypothetical protein
VYEARLLAIDECWSDGMAVVQLTLLHIYTICIDENDGGEVGKHDMGYLYHSCYCSDMNYVNT